MVNPGAIATTSLVPGATPSASGVRPRGPLALRRAAAARSTTRCTPPRRRPTTGTRASRACSRATGALCSDPAEAVDVYTRQCSPERDRPGPGGDGGDARRRRRQPADPRAGGHPPRSAGYALAVMATAGLYETSGEWLYDVGLPGKSGIGGGIVTVVAGQGGLGTFAPRLDAAGNSVKGQLAARFLSQRARARPVRLDGPTRATERIARRERRGSSCSCSSRRSALVVAPRPPPTWPTRRRSPRSSRPSCASSSRRRSAARESPTSRSTSTRSSASRRSRSGAPGTPPTSSRSARRPPTSPGRYEYHLDYPGSALDPGCDYEQWARRLTRAPNPRCTRTWRLIPAAREARAAVLVLLRLQRLQQHARGRLGDDPARLRRRRRADALDGARSRSATARTRAPRGRRGTRTSSRSSTAPIPSCIRPQARTPTSSPTALYLGSSPSRGRVRRHPGTASRRYAGRPNDPERSRGRRRRVPVDHVRGTLGRAAEGVLQRADRPQHEDAVADADRMVARTGAIAATPSDRGSVRHERHRLLLLRRRAGSGASLAAPEPARGVLSSSEPPRPARLRRDQGDLDAGAPLCRSAPARVGPDPLRVRRDVREAPRLFLGLGLLLIPIGIVTTFLQWLLLSAFDLVGSVTGDLAGAVRLSGDRGGSDADPARARARHGGDRLRARRARRGPAGRPGHGVPARAPADSAAAPCGRALRADVGGAHLDGGPHPLRAVVRGAVGLLAPVAELEDRGGRDALRRSAELVRGRWLRVGSLVVLGGLLALVSGPLLGALLIFVSNSSLALLNLVAGIVYAVALPFVALVTSYVYFDARTRHELEPARRRRASGRDRARELRRQPGRRARCECRQREIRRRTTASVAGR